MKSEFFCNKCMKHLHVKFLAYRYSDNKKACCTHCKELVEQRAKPESSESRIKEKNKKVTLLDSFYVEKRIDDKIYISASKKLNSLIGNESPVYTALRKQKEEEERERKRQLAIQKRKSYIAMHEEQIAENLSPEGIKKNIELLSYRGFKSKMAAG